MAEHNSEWWAPASQAMLDQFAAVEKEPEEALLRAHEQERVQNLSWMDKPEMQQLGFSGPKVWFFYPMAFFGLNLDDEMDMSWLIVPKGQLTFDAEGNDIETSVYFSRRPHVPNNKGVVIGASGVTFGRGLDLGQVTDTIFSELSLAISKSCKPLSGSMVLWLKNAVGRQKSNAYNYSLTLGEAVEKRAQELTRKQQHYLFNAIYARLEAVAKRTIENAKGLTLSASSGAEKLDPDGVVSWDELPQKVKDILVDLTFRGDNKGSTRAYFVPSLIKDIKLGGDFIFFKENLNSTAWVTSFKVPSDRYQRRCKYL